MTRHLFGAGPASWTFANDGTNTPMIGGAVVQAFNAQVGGTQYVDLALDAEGTQIVDHVNSSDTSDGLQLGQIPPFYGPDGVWEMWLSANGGPRVLAMATDLGTSIAQNVSDIAAVNSDLTAFIGTVGQPNGIAPLDADGLLAAANRWTPQFSFSGATDYAGTAIDQAALIYSSSTSKWTVTDTVGAWTTASVGGTGLSSTDARYRKIPLLGLIEIQVSGNVSSGITHNDTLFTLPTGYRPSYGGLSYPIATNNVSSNYGRIDIATDGTVMLVGTFNGGSPPLFRVHALFTP
jgi:hypothetical protein